jgi:hypothetical protein
MNLAKLIMNPKPPTNGHKGETGYYSEVYFRIERNGYSGRGWDDQRIENGAWKSERREAFTSEVAGLFTAHGWTLEDGKYNGSANTVFKGKSCLYLHPQNFSGIAENSLIEEVAAFLSCGKSFELPAVDIYEEIFDWPESEINAYFEQLRPDVDAAIIKRYTTKRRNLFTVGTEALRDTANSFSIPVMPGTPDFSPRKAYPRYVAELFDEMLKNGRIVSATTKHGTGYRYVGNDKSAKIHAALAKAEKTGEPA